jgi:hypothetical protein
VGLPQLELLVERVHLGYLNSAAAGEFGWSRRGFADGGSTVVAVLPEASGDDVVSHHQKYQEGEDEESRKSKKMPSNLEVIELLPTSKAPILEGFRILANAIENVPHVGESIRISTTAACEINHTSAEIGLDRISRKRSISPYGAAMSSSVSL